MSEERSYVGQFNSKSSAIDSNKIPSAAPTDEARELAETFRKQAVSNLLWPFQGDAALTESLACFLSSALTRAREEGRREASPKWISVKNGLPSQNTAVLVINGNGTSADEREPIIGFIEESAWFRTWSSEELIVSHWMPLPLFEDRAAILGKKGE